LYRLVKDGKARIPELKRCPASAAFSAVLRCEEELPKSPESIDCGFDVDPSMFRSPSPMLDTSEDDSDYDDPPVVVRMGADAFGSGNKKHGAENRLDALLEAVEDNDPEGVELRDLAMQQQCEAVEFSAVTEMKVSPFSSVLLSLMIAFVIQVSTQSIYIFILTVICK
jgi:hypothetical protein